MSQLAMPSPIPAPYTLDHYVADVAALIERGGPMQATVEAVLAAKKRFVTSGAGIPAQYTHMNPTVPYTRNLVHLDPAGRFCVIALVWGPFQETAVHDHMNWCVVGVVSGCAHITNYDRLDDETDPARVELVIRNSAMAPPGSAAALLPPRRSNIHKMANAGRLNTVSLHTYGDAGNRARAFDPREGTARDIELRFHNLMS